MNRSKRTFVDHLLIWTLLSGSLLACGAHHPQKAAAPEESSTEEVRADADAVRSQEPAPAPPSDEKTQSPAQSAERQFEGETSDEETLPAGPFGPREKKEAQSMNEQLAAALVDFRSQMGAEELSCAGARPLRESICSLAERICKSSDPSSIDSKKQCTEAQKTCSEADRSYRNKCGAP